MTLLGNFAILLLAAIGIGMVGALTQIQIMSQQVYAQSAPDGIPQVNPECQWDTVNASYCGCVNGICT